MVSRHQHIVTRALQQHWADVDGDVQLIDTTTGEARPVSPRNSLVRSHFNSFRTEAGYDDRLEREWAKLENDALPVVRDFLAGRRPMDPRVDMEIKVLVAMHLVRSPSTKILHDRILDEAPEEFAGEEVFSPELIDRWREERGADPTVNEVLEIARQLVEFYRRSNSLYVERLVSVYNQIIEELPHRHLQFVGAGPTFGFVMGDVGAFPVQGRRVGIHRGVGALAAEAIRMPLTPRIAVQVRRERQRSVVLDVAETQMWNHTTRRCADRFIIAEAGVDWRRASLASSA